MAKYLRALEVPFYLLVIALGVLKQGNIGLAIILILVSVGRLIINGITDEFIYKK